MLNILHSCGDISHQLDFYLSAPEIKCVNFGEPEKYDFARILLVLPFVIQPRFDIGAWNWIIGGLVLAAAMVFGIPALSIDWRTAPDSKMVLKTNGIYRVVRNPIYLTDLLFSLGFAIMFGSSIGVALILIWWAAFLAIVLVEETSLERALGQRYLDYKQQVKGRIIPGLPI